MVAGTNPGCGGASVLASQLVKRLTPPLVASPKLALPAHLPDTRPVNDPVTQLTNDLIASYARVGGINHLDGKNLPSKRVVTSITKDLLRLLFPGFFDEKLIHSSEIKAETAVLLDSVIGKLEDEIRKSLEYNPPADLPRRTSPARRTR